MSALVAVIGANGQIGAALCRQINASGSRRPVAIVRSRMAAALVSRKVGSQIEVRVGSFDRSGARTILDGCAAVVNCALATTGGARATRDANRTIFEACTADSKRLFVHLSTVAVVGAPSSPYGAEKLAHERLVERLARSGGLRSWYIVRVGHVYGPGCPTSRFIADHLETPGFVLPFSGNVPSNAVSMARVAAALDQLCANPVDPGIWNLIDEPNGSWRELFDVHAQAFGRPLAATHDGDPLAMERPSQGSMLSGVFAACKPGINVAGLTRNEPIRRFVNDVFAALPARVERIVRHVYARRQVMTQVSALSAMKPAVEPWLSWQPVLGRNLPSVPVADGAVELRHWYRRISDPRWELATWP